MDTRRNRRTFSCAPLVGGVVTSTTPLDTPLFDLRHYPQNALDCSPTNLSEPKKLATPEGGSHASSNHPLAPVDMMQGLQVPQEVRLVGRYLLVTPVHGRLHFINYILA